LLTRAFVFSNGGGDADVSQSLGNVDGEYMFSYRFAVLSGVNVGAGFGCSIIPSIGGSVLQGSYPDGYSSWTPESQRWSTEGNTVSDAQVKIQIQCSGEYDVLTIGLDDVTLTRICEVEAP